MKETEKQYYGRRGKEERERSRGAGSEESRSLHNELADLHMERANGSSNENGRNRWKRSGPGLEAEAQEG
jgi:hypothetical protein